MGNVILGTTMSLDGFTNDRNGDISRLYPDLEELHTIPQRLESQMNRAARAWGVHTHSKNQLRYKISRSSLQPIA